MYATLWNMLALTNVRADTKCAAFLNCKPMFQFVLGPVLVPSSMQERIKPPASSELHKLGSAFFGNCLLSSPLVETLGMIQNILLFVQASSEDPDDFSVEDHDFFRLLNCQAEHRLLSYVCTGPATPCGKVPVHFIEEVVRTACICYLNDITIFSPPASGLGRRLTKHLQGAIFKCGLPMVKELDQMKSGIIAWASMVGAQGSDGQAEYPWFLERLTAVARMNEMA